MRAQLQPDPNAGGSSTSKTRQVLFQKAEIGNGPERCGGQKEAQCEGNQNLGSTSTRPKGRRRVETTKAPGLVGRRPVADSMGVPPPAQRPRGGRLGESRQAHSRCVSKPCRAMLQPDPNAGRASTGSKCRRARVSVHPNQLCWSACCQFTRIQMWANCTRIQMWAMTPRSKCGQTE